MPLLTKIVPDTTRYDVRDGIVTVDWGMEDGATLRLIANLSEKNGKTETDATTGGELFSLGTISAKAISPWAVQWTLQPA